MNVQAGLIELSKMLCEREYMDRAAYLTDFQRIFKAMLPKEEYTCKHWIDGQITGECKLHHSQVSKEDKTLSEKFKQQGHLWYMGLPGKVEPCVDTLVEIAKQHYAKEIERARQEGLFEGHKQSQHLSFMDGKIQATQEFKMKYNRALEDYLKSPLDYPNGPVVLLSERLFGEKT